MKSLRVVLTLLITFPTVAQEQFIPLPLRESLPQDPTNPSEYAVLADIDGDSDLDVLIDGTFATRILRNRGPAAFEEDPASLPSALGNSSFHLFGDVDGDSDLDIVFNRGPNASPDRLGMLLNDGTGVFTSASANLPVGTGHAAGRFELGDIDGDGDLDIVQAFNLTHHVFVNDGNGNFTDESFRIPSGTAPAASDVALFDMDADGDLDFLVGFQIGADQLWENDGTGHFVDVTATKLRSFVDPTEILRIADIDGDSDLDIVTQLGPFAPGNIRVFTNDGAGNFTYGTVGPPLPVYDWLDLADLDGDGDLDIVQTLSRTAPAVRVLENDGTGAFTDVTSTLGWTEVSVRMRGALGDLDGDGDADYLAASESQDRLFLNDGTGKLELVTERRLPFRTQLMTQSLAADWNGDGILDVALGRSIGDIEIWLGTGLGGFATRTLMTNRGIFVSRLAGGDVDGDGDMDLMVAAGDGSLLFTNDGSANFTKAPTTRMPSQARLHTGVTLGDIDGDSDLDAWFTLDSVDQGVLYVNDGSGSFTDETFRVARSGRRALEALFVDVDGDGDVDLFHCFRDGDGLLLNDGTGLFQTGGTLPPTSATMTDVIAGDLDRDGDLDLLERASSSAQRYLVNDGFGNFTNESSRLPAQLTGLARFVDFDRDGALDIALLVGPTPPFAMWRNDGSGNFVDETSTRITGRVNFSSAVEVLDIDRDGDEDIVAWDNPSLVFVNQHRHLRVPYPPKIDGIFRVDVLARVGGASHPGVLAGIVLSNQVLSPAIPWPGGGALQFDPNSYLLFPGQLITHPSNRTSLEAPIPNDSALVGAPLVLQALLLENGSLDIELTNLLDERILN